MKNHKLNLLSLTFTTFFALSGFAKDQILNFDNGLEGWNTRRVTKPWSLKIVNEDLLNGEVIKSIDGGNFARFELRDNDYVRVNDGFRSELKDRFTPKQKEEVQYSFSTYIPESYPNGDYDCMHAQWHNVVSETQPVGREPSLSHRYVNGVLKITLKYLKYKNLYPSIEEWNKAFEAANSNEHGSSIVEIPLQKGQWHTFHYKIRWAADNTGYVIGTINNKLVVNYKGPIGYGDEEPSNYFKLGMYCQKKPVGEVFVVYHDNYSTKVIKSSKY
jgi:hypothetical protein